MLRLKKIDNRSLWILGIIAFILVVFLYRTYDGLAGGIADLKKDLSDTQFKLAQTEETLSEIISGNTDLEERLSEETKKRLLAEQSEEEARNLFEGKIVELQTGLKEQQEAVLAGDISRIISEWSPRVARLICTTSDESGDTSKSRGSSVATYLGSVPHLITNKHVVEESGEKLVSCSVEFISGEKITVDSDSVTVSEKVDVGYLRVPQASFDGIDDPIRACSNKPDIGDSVVILGYPNVGGSGITATEGIISGFDDEYYVTSAKIEQGNSGGAAIHVQDNCFLGMPTLVLSGRIESLARILPI